MGVTAREANPARRVVVNQPYYFARLHWWERALRGRLVLLDDVQQNDSLPSNRALLHDGSADQWLTVPVKKGQRRTFMRDIALVEDRAWVEEHRRKIEAYYRRAPHLHAALAVFDAFAAELRPGQRLVEVVTASLRAAAAALALPADWQFSSTLAPDAADRDDRMIKICQRTESPILVMGLGSKAGYLDAALPRYETAGIRIEYQEWRCPVENRSILDAVARHGPNRVQEILRTS